MRLLMGQRQRGCSRAQADLTFPPPAGILRILVRTRADQAVLVERLPPNARKGKGLIAADLGLRPSSDLGELQDGHQRKQCVPRGLTPLRGPLRGDRGRGSALWDERGTHVTCRDQIGQQRWQSSVVEKSLDPATALSVWKSCAIVI